MDDERRVKASRNEAETGTGKAEVPKDEAEADTGTGKAEVLKDEAGTAAEEPRLRRRGVLQCPSCMSWLPQLSGPFCPFCHARVPTRPSPEPSPSPPAVSEEDVEKELAEMDEDAEPIKTSRSGPDIRYYQCPRCRAYVDALVVVEGHETLVYDDLLVCPRCGFSEEFDSVEYEDGKPFFVTKYPLLKGEYVGHLDRRLRRAVRAASGEILQMGLFTADEQYDNEPQWPRAVAAVLMGTAMHVGEKLERVINALEKVAFGPQRAGGKRHRGGKKGKGKGKDGPRFDRAPRPDASAPDPHRGGERP